MMATGKRLFPASALLVLTLAGILGPLDAFSAITPPYTFSGPTLVDQYPGIDILPTAFQASNGTIWLAWQSNRYWGSTSAKYDILFKTYTNGAWSTASRFTSSGQNAAPALAQLNNNTILLVWAQKLTTNYNLYYKRFNVDLQGNQVWSGSVQLTSTSLNDTLPSAAVGRDGTLWLVWTRMNTTCTTTCSTTRQLYYKTLKAGAWYPEVKLTSDNNWNWGSSVMVGKDGKARVVWSKGQPPATVQVYYKTYNGSAWSSETQVVSSTTEDDHPSTMQDRNGTLWIFWGRQVQVSGGFYYVLYNKFSTDNGLTWSSESQMTFTSNSVDSKMPTAIQSTGDKSIWVFYVTNPVSDDDIWRLNSPPVSPVHDVTVSFLSPSTILQYPGGLKSIGQSAIVTISVTVADLGDFPETVNVSLNVFNTTSTSLGSHAGSVTAGSSVVIVFSWNTTNVKPARYGLSASVSPVPKETIGDAGDNNLVATNQVHILPWGDIDQNGAVTLTDVSVVFFDFGFSSTCGCSRWNPFADINGNGIIDIIDVGVVSKNYGIMT